MLPVKPVGRISSAVDAFSPGKLPLLPAKSIARRKEITELYSAGPQQHQNATEFFF